MQRVLGAAVLLLGGLGCGDETPSQPCPTGPDFNVSVTSVTGRLPASTQVEVTFGGGSRELYSPLVQAEPSVLFCDAYSAGSGGAGGAGGDEGGASSADNNAPHHIQRIDCSLWTHGPASVSVQASSWQETRELKLEDEECHLDEEIVLGETKTEP